MTIWERWFRHPQRLWLRRAVFQVHLWAGIGIGLYILVISVSGSILIYRSELRQMFSPQPKIVSANTDQLSSHELTESAQRAYPDHRVSIFAEPDDPTHAVTISINEDGAVQLMYFDPYTGEDLGHAMPLGWRLTTWLLDLHDNLLYGSTGRAVNGVAALLTMLVAVTGGFIWWPGIQSWRRSLIIDFRSNWRRINWSLHSAVGFWTFIFVVMWGVTGVYLSFAQQFMDVVDYFEPLNLETFEPRLGEAVLSWLAKLHFGRFGGWSTKLLWVIVGLAPPLMFVTGLVMWWNRVVRSQDRSRKNGVS